MERARFISSIACLTCGVTILLLGNEGSVACFTIITPLPCTAVTSFSTAGIAFTMIGATLFLVTLVTAIRERNENQIDTT